MNNGKRRITMIPPKPEMDLGKASRRQLRVAAYCRVSTDDEEQLTSYDAQKAYYTDKAQQTDRSVIGMTNYNSLTSMVKEKAKNGYILISATNHTKVVVDIRHGHAGLIYNPTQLSMIHAPGPGEKSKKESVRNITSLGDSDMKVRLYKVQNVSDSTAKNVANYANENLLGLDYHFYSKVTDDTVNCATLVWKAYNSEGISLGKYFGTVTPESLVQDYSTIGVATVNWQGDHNSFDLIQTTSDIEE